MMIAPPAGHSYNGFLFEEFPRGQITSLPVLGRAVRPDNPVGLGSAGVGAELGGGSGEFLLTRPSPRRRFLWVSWGIGLMESFLVLAVVAAIVMTALRYELGPTWQHIRAPYRTGYALMQPFDLLCRFFAAFSVTAALTYGLTYFMAVATRSAQRAVNYSGAIIIGYMIGSSLLARYANLHLPGLTGTPFYGSELDFTLWRSIIREFPVLPLLSRALVAVVFPFAAQFVLDRAEL